VQANTPSEAADAALARVVLLLSVSGDTRGSKAASIPGRAAKSAASRFISGSQ